MQNARKVATFSPNNISNKERYLSEGLAKFKNRLVCGFEGDDKGEISLWVGERITGVKYFVKVYKKSEYESTIQFLNGYEQFLKSTNCKRMPRMLKEVHYKEYVVLLFKIEKRKRNKKRKKDLNL